MGCEVSHEFREGGEWESGGEGEKEEEEEGEEEEKRDESSGKMVWDHLQSIILSYPLVGRKGCDCLFWLRILPKESVLCACFCAMGLIEQKTEARSKVGGCKAQTMSEKVVGLFVCLLVWLEAGKGEEGGGGHNEEVDVCVCVGCRLYAVHVFDLALR
jgi:hypothetical protein